MQVLETFDLTKAYGKQLAVDKLNIGVEEGDVFGFLGPNGAGKTTTIKMLCGLLKPTSGSGTVSGFDICKESVKARVLLGVVPERDVFYEGMSGDRFLNYFAKLHRIPSKERESRAEEVLEIVGLKDARRKKISTYSHGMRRKLSIARAILHDPKILILDEPTSGLDPTTQVTIRNLIKRSNATIFISSHNLYEVEELCNRVAVINRGKLVIQDNVESLRKNIRGETVEVKLKYATEQVINAVTSLDFVKEISKSEGSLLITVEDYENDAPELTRAVVGAGGDILKLDRTSASLYDIFMDLTRGDDDE